MSNLKRIIMFLTIIIFMLVLSGGCNVSQPSGISPQQLTCEYLVDPSVIDVTHPRLSWVNVAPRKDKGQVQTAYQIQAATSRERLLNEEADLWDSEKVDSNQSLAVVTAWCV